MTLHQLGLFAEASEDSHQVASNNLNALAKHLLRAFCKLCDQSLFLLVEWARNSVFFKHLKVSSNLCSLFLLKKIIMGEGDNF